MVIYDEWKDITRPLRSHNHIIYNICPTLDIFLFYFFFNFFSLPLNAMYSSQCDQFFDLTTPFSIKPSPNDNKCDYESNANFRMNYSIIFCKQSSRCTLDRNELEWYAFDEYKYFFNEKKEWMKIASFYSFSLVFLFTQCILSSAIAIIACILYIINQFQKNHIQVHCLFVISSFIIFIADTERECVFIVVLIKLETQNGKRKRNLSAS